MPQTFQQLLLYFEPLLKLRTLGNARQGFYLTCIVLEHSDVRHNFENLPLRD